MTDQSVILIVDDSELLLERMKQRLEADGYRVITTTQTVGAARHLLGAQLVIIDWHMPGISGGEVLKSFRSAVQSSKRKPRFYLYTSDAQVSLVAKDLGFDGVFINKGDDDALTRQVAAAFRIIKFQTRGQPG
jgi:two-component system OmpR family response regulator